MTTPKHGFVSKARSRGMLAFVFLGVFLFPAHLWPLTNLAVDVLVGFNGRFKPGHWTPVQVTASNLRQEIDGSLELEVAHGDEYRGNFNRFAYTKPLLLPRNSSKRFDFVVPLYGSFQPLRLKIRHQGELLYERDIDLRGAEFAERLILALSRDVSLDFLSLLAGPVVSQNDPDRFRVIYPHVEFLPHSWAGYDAVDAVVFHNVTARSLSEEQRKALELWVVSGGTLIVSGGTHLTAGSLGLLDSLLPVEIAGQMIVESYSALENRFGEEVANREPLIVSLAKPVRGEVILEQDGVPLVVAEVRGKGRVVFLAFDFAAYPIQTWPGKYELWRSILPAKTSKNVVQDTSFVEIGTPEKETSLLEAALSEPLPPFPSHLILAGLLAVYIIFLWFFLRRKSRIRRSVRILSIFLSAVFIAGISYALLNTWLFREDMLFADIDLIESSPGWNFGSLEKEVGFLSTHGKSISVSLGHTDFGISGDDVLLEPEGADDLTVSQNRDARIGNVLLDPWALRRFKVRAMVPFPSEGGTVREGGLLRIRMKNTGLSTLRSALLWYRGIPYYVGDIPPDQEITEDFRIYQSVESIREELPLASYFPDPDRDTRIKLGVLKNLLGKPEWDYSLQDDTAILTAWIDETPLKAETAERFVHRYSYTLAFLVFQAESGATRLGS